MRKTSHQNKINESVVVLGFLLGFLSLFLSVKGTLIELAAAFSFQKLNAMVKYCTNSNINFSK